MTNITKIKEEFNKEYYYKGLTVIQRVQVKGFIEEKIKEVLEQLKDFDIDVEYEYCDDFNKGTRAREKYLRQKINEILK